MGYRNSPRPKMTYEIADGGFIDWTQHLLQNKKERMFTTGFGFDLMYRILHGM